jgi:hypothetical protein
MKLVDYRATYDGEKQMYSLCISTGGGQQDAESIALETIRQYEGCCDRSLLSVKKI